MKPLYLVVAIIIFLLVILTAVTVFFFNFAIVGKRLSKENAIKRAKNHKVYKTYADRIVNGIEWISNCKQKHVEIKSYDNIKLFGTLIEAEDKTDNTVILFHGWTSRGFFDFSCIIEMYHKNGFNVLMPDQRAHGMSGGKYTCFGVKERYDVISWVNYVISLYGENCKIVIEGISMGASTVLMAAGLNELSPCVKGIIADCGFTSAADQFTHVLKKDYHLPPFPFLYTANLLTRMIAGFGFWDVNAAEEVKKSELPLLIIHGEDDDFVPVKFGRQIYEASASENKQIITVPGAKHGMSYFIDEEHCRSVLENFLKNVFENQ